MRFNLQFKEAFLICFLLTTSCGGSGTSSTPVTSSPTENPPVTSSPNPPVTSSPTDPVTPQPPDDPVVTPPPPETPPPNPPLSTATVPSPPREVIGQSPSYHRIRIRWEEPETDGDDPITGYIIHRYTNQSCSGTPAGTYSASAGATSVIIPGLEEQTTYWFTVTAVNGVGESLASSCAAETTGIAPPRAINPRAEVAFSGTLSDLEIQVTFMWDASLPEMIHSYNLRFHRDNACQQPFVQASSRQGITSPYIFDVSDSDPFRDISFNVRAFDLNGGFDDSDCVTVTISPPECNSVDDQTTGTYPACRLPEEVEEVTCDPRYGSTVGVNPQCIERMPDFVLSNEESGIRQIVPFSRPSALQGRTTFYNTLEMKSKVDAAPNENIPFIFIDVRRNSEEEPGWSHGEQVLIAFCYHKPDNCGQDLDGAKLHPEDAIALPGLEFIGLAPVPGFFNPDSEGLNTLEVEKEYDAIVNRLRQDNEGREESDKKQGFISISGNIAAEFFINNTSERREVPTELYLISSATNAEFDLPVPGDNVIDSDGNPVPEFDIATAIRETARPVTLNNGETVTIPGTLLVTGYVYTSEGIILRRGSRCEQAETFCMVAPYAVSLPSEAEDLPTGLSGNSYATPSVTATLYATSQLFPTLTRDQVVARFVECLTYPQQVPTFDENGRIMRDEEGNPILLPLGTTDENGTRILSEEERGTWGLGIPDLACIAAPIGDIAMQTSSGTETVVQGNPLPGVTVKTTERRYGVPFDLTATSERFEVKTLSLGDTPQTLLRQGSMIPLASYPSDEWVFQPLLHLQENAISGGGFRVLKDTLGFGIAYQTPNDYFGGNKGSGSFDPGVLHETTFATSFHHRMEWIAVNAQFTASWVKSEGGSLVDLEGLGWKGESETRIPYGNLDFVLGASYGEVHTRYRVGEHSYKVPVHATVEAWASTTFTHSQFTLDMEARRSLFKNDTAFEVDTVFEAKLSFTF